MLPQKIEKQINFLLKSHKNKIVGIFSGYHLIDDSWQYQRNLRYQILHHCFTSVEHKIAQKIDAFYDFLILFYKCLTKIAQK